MHVDTLRRSPPRIVLAGDHPTLTETVGTNGNDLLGLATATCDERLVELLLEHGADPARANAHGWTPLHQAAYSGLAPLASILIEAGAPLHISARGDGGTPLIVALFWGNRRASELLVAHGAAIDADVYRGTALAWAAARGHAASARRLLVLGADPNTPTTFGGPGHGDRATALHLAAQSGDIDTIDVLIQAGADPTIRDGRHNATPAGWAEHERRDAALAVLRGHGG